MPYSSNSELPPNVRMPAHRQKAFREAFNNAYDEYAGDELRAFAVAYAASQRKPNSVTTAAVAHSPKGTRDENGAQKIEPPSSPRRC